MSTDIDKFKHSKRLLKDDAAMKKQIGIAKQHGTSLTKPHSFAKTHAMTCGDSNCVMCGNPRKVWGEKTIQEQRFDQTASWTTLSEELDDNSSDS